MKQLFIFLASTFLYVGASAQNLTDDLFVAEPELISSDTTIYNQFRDYVEFQQAQEKRHEQYRPMPHAPFIRPKEIVKKRDVVIVIYDRKDFERLEHFRRYQMMKMRQRPLDWRK